jgi:DNA-binding MarR family transcriptional regulator
MKSPTIAAEGFLLEEFLPYELSVAANRISRLFARRYSAEFGLSIAQWRVLAVVGRFGSIAPGVVAERAEMDKVKVSRAAASLVQSGLVEQSTDPADGRARRLRLTAQGEAVHSAIVPRARALESQLAASMDGRDWDRLRAALRGLTRHAALLEDALLEDANPAPSPTE